MIILDNAVFAAYDASLKERVIEAAEEFNLQDEVRHFIWDLNFSVEDVYSVYYEHRLGKAINEARSLLEEEFKRIYSDER